MPKRGWRHPITGEAISTDDERLVGMGNPPHAPGPVGHGTIPLTAAMLTDAEHKAASDRANANRSGSRRRPHSFPEFKDEA